MAVTTDRVPIFPLLEHAPHIDIGTSRTIEQSGRTSGEMKSSLIKGNRERWPDDRLPVLDGRTPREAAAIPELRGKLILLVKHLVNKADRESLAASEHATQLIATLGLDEIAEPTPPMRPDVYERDDEPDDDPVRRRTAG